MTRRFSRKLGNKNWGVVLFVCLCARLLFFSAVQPWNPQVETEVILHSDPKGYHQLASTLLASHRFANTPTGPPNAYRTPFYPSFVAAIYWLFGQKPWIVMLFQIVIDTCSCILLLFAISRFLNPRIAFISSLFYAIDPFLILYSSTLYVDILFIFFLIASLYFFNSAIRTGEIAVPQFTLSTLLLGCATLVKPISQYIPSVFIVFLFIYYRHRLWKAITYSILCLLVFGATLSPWLIRNYNTFGYLSLSQIGAHSLLSMSITPMEMARRKQAEEKVMNDLFSEADKMMASDGLEPQRLNPFQKAEYWQRLAIRYILRDPFLFAKTYCMGVFHMFAGVGTSTFAKMLGLPISKFNVKDYTNVLDLFRNFFKEKGKTDLIIATFVGAYILISYVAMVVGLVISWKRYPTAPLLYCLLFILYFVTITGAGANARYKLPLIPFYLPFVGIGMNYLYEKVRSGSKLKPQNSIKQTF